MKKNIFRIGFVLCILFAIICGFKVFPRYYNKYTKGNVSIKTSLIVGEKDETERLLDDIVIEDDKILFSIDNLRRFIDGYLCEDDKYNQIITNSKNHVKVIDLKQSKMREYLSEDWEDIYLKKIDGKYYVDLKEWEDIYGINVKYTKDVNIVKVEKDIHTYSVGTLNKKVSIMTLPSKISAQIDVLQPNDYVYILRTDKDYYKVLDSIGRFGYVKQSDIPEDCIKKVCNYAPIKMDTKVNLSWDYVNYESPDRSSERKIEGVNVISPTWINLLDKNGNIQNNSDSSYTNWAKSNEYKIWPMFSNDSKIEATRNIMQDSKLRESLIAKLLKVCIDNKFDGINIDFENMYKEDRDLFTQFIREMTVTFNNNNLLVSVDVTVPDGSDTWSMCFDRMGLGDAANYVVLMAYDQTPGASQKPNSNAAADWIEKYINRLLEEVDEDKLILGIPFYMRIWKTTSDGKVSSNIINMSEISNYLIRNNLTKTWLEDKKQNYVKYSIGGTSYEIWIEDVQSIEEKMKLLKQYELAGVASWEKDREDASVWKVINSYLYK